MDTYTHSSSWEDAVTQREGAASADSAPNPQDSPEPFTPSTPSTPSTAGAPGAPAGIVRARDGLSNRGLLLAAGTVCAGCALAALAAAAVWALGARRRSLAAQQPAQRPSPPPAGSEPEAGPESEGGSRVTGVEGWKTELWRPLRSGRAGFMGRLRSVPAGRTF